MSEKSYTLAADEGAGNTPESLTTNPVKEGITMAVKAVKDTVHETQGHASITEALAAAQMEMGRALKDSSNPHFKSKYADLASVQDACMGALNRHGIAVIQPVNSTETGEHFVVTRFLHPSGELECSIPLILGKRDMQGLGSAITYARRYGLMSLAGIAPDDDDGNAAAATMNGNNAASEGIKDAWKDAVLDSLPENATPVMKARAFAKQIAEDMKAKKSLRGLDAEWAKRERMLNDMSERFPDAFGDVLEVYTHCKSAFDADAA